MFLYRVLCTCAAQLKVHEWPCKIQNFRFIMDAEYTYILMDVKNLKFLKINSNQMSFKFCLFVLISCFMSTVNRKKPLWHSG